MKIERYPNETDANYIKRLENTITNLNMSIEGYKAIIEEDNKEHGVRCMDCKSILTANERLHGGLCRDCKVSPYNPLDN